MEQVPKQDLEAVMDWLRFSLYADGVSQRAPQIGFWLAVPCSELVLVMKWQQFQSCLREEVVLLRQEASSGHADRSDSTVSFGWENVHILT